MKTSLLTMGLGVAFVCSVMNTADAQIRPGGGSLTLVAGVYSFNEFQGDTDPMFGVRVGGVATKFVGVEGAVDIIPTGEGLNVFGYQGNVLIHLAPDQRTVPFFIVGIGGVTFTNGGSETRFATNLGLGIKVLSAGKAGLRLEAKDRIYRLGNDTLNDFHFTAGVEVSF